MEMVVTQPEANIGATGWLVERGFNIRQLLSIILFWPKYWKSSCNLAVNDKV